MADEFKLRELELREKQFEAENKIHQEEIAIKRGQLELEAKKIQEKRSTLSPIKVGIISAVIGLIGVVFGAISQGYWSIELENEKLKSQVIMKGLEGDDKNEKARYFKFVGDMKIFKDEEFNKKLMNVNPDDIPNLKTSIGRAEYRAKWLDNIFQTNIELIAVPPKDLPDQKIPLSDYRFTMILSRKHELKELKSHMVEEFLDTAILWDALSSDELDEAKCCWSSQ